ILAGKQGTRIIMSPIFSPATDMNPFQLGDLFQDDLRLIPLKPQLASLRLAGFLSLHFAKII
ncbi:MAG: hypothetical protein ABIK68_08005, partial [bacterium]